MDIRSKGITRLLMVASLAIILVSIPLIVLSHVKPTQLREEVELFRIDYNIAYNYTAEVKPSIIYGYKKEVISMDQPLYTPLTRNILLDLKLNISSPQKIKTINGKANIKVVFGEEEGWSIVLSEINENITSNKTKIRIPIDMEYVKNIINEVKAELNIPISSYYIRIEPTITVTTVVTNGKIVGKTLEAPLKINLGSGRSKISFSGLEFSDAYEKKDERHITQYISLLGLTTTVLTARYISYVLAGVGTVLLVTSMVLSSRRPKNVVEDILSKYGNFIIRASRTVLGSQKIYVNDFSQLVKISRIVGRPIIYTAEGDVHRFVLVDSGTLYVYELRRDDNNDVES